MGFRYVEGPDRELFKRRFRRDPETLIPRTLERWRNRSLLAADRLALNREGLLFLNAFLVEAFGELEAGAGDYA
jgi:oxygen-independent coproporphyrinogen-3 oxidase